MANKSILVIFTLVLSAVFRHVRVTPFLISKLQSSLYHFETVSELT